MVKQLWLKFKSCTWYLHTADTPSINNLRVMSTGTTLITISWTSTSVGSVTYTIITYSTGDVMISSKHTNDTSVTIDGLDSGTSYRISVVPSMGMCEGEGKEMMVDTNGTLTTVGKQICIVITILYLLYLLNIKVKFTVQIAQYACTYVRYACMSVVLLIC